MLISVILALFQSLYLHWITTDYAHSFLSAHSVIEVVTCILLLFGWLKHAVGRWILFALLLTEVGLMWGEYTFSPDHLPMVGVFLIRVVVLNYQDRIVRFLSAAILLFLLLTYSTATIQRPVDGDDTYGFPFTFLTLFSGMCDPCPPVMHSFIPFWLIADVLITLSLTFGGWKIVQRTYDLERHAQD